MSKKTVNERTFTLATGRVVVGRMMTVEEWEALEDKRVEAVEASVAAAEKGRHDSASLILQRFNRDSRREKFALCVPTWDALRKELTTAEMNDLSRQIEAAMWPEVVEGNLSAGGTGQTTASE